MLDFFESVCVRESFATEAAGSRLIREAGGIIAAFHRTWSSGYMLTTSMLPASPPRVVKAMLATCVTELSDGAMNVNISGW